MLAGIRSCTGKMAGLSPPSPKPTPSPPGPAPAGFCQSVESTAKKSLRIIAKEKDGYSGYNPETHNNYLGVKVLYKETCASSSEAEREACAQKCCHTCATYKDCTHWEYG
jgi:hypothetical protein